MSLQLNRLGEFAGVGSIDDTVWTSCLGVHGPGLLTASGVEVGGSLDGVESTELMASGDDGFGQFHDRARIRGPDDRRGPRAAVPFPKRLGEPAEFADAALFLLSNGYVHGEVMYLDGEQRFEPR